MTDRGAVTILVVDDDMVDRMAIKRALKALAIGNPVVEAVDGIEALERLRGENGRAMLVGNVLVLLDLNMPRMGGLEFLAQLREDPGLRATLVFVLTTSLAESDRKAAYAKNVAGYMLKQRPGQSLMDIMGVLEHYWRMIEFPPRRDDAGRAWA